MVRRACCCRVAPEEVELVTYDENKLGRLGGVSSQADEYKNGTASSAQQNSLIHIERQQLDTTIVKSAPPDGDKATTTFVSLTEGLRVVPFNLFRTLRVHSVVDDKQQPLAFIQEDKNDDADFSVILPRPPRASAKSM